MSPLLTTNDGGGRRLNKAVWKASYASAKTWERGGTISLETADMVNCYSHVFSLMHPHHLFSSNSVYTYPTFLNHVFLYLTTGLHAWIYFCLHFPNFTSFSFRLPLPFALRFHFVFFYGITEFVLYLYV